jgi:hypothetical protein
MSNNQLVLSGCAATKCAVPEHLIGPLPSQKVALLDPMEAAASELTTSGAVGEEIFAAEGCLGKGDSDIGAGQQQPEGGEHSSMTESPTTLTSAHPPLCYQSRADKTPGSPASTCGLQCPLAQDASGQLVITHSSGAAVSDAAAQLSMDNISKHGSSNAEQLCMSVMSLQVALSLDQEALPLVPDLCSVNKACVLQDDANEGSSEMIPTSGTTVPQLASLASQRLDGMRQESKETLHNDHAVSCAVHAAEVHDTLLLKHTTRQLNTNTPTANPPIAVSNGKQQEALLQQSSDIHTIWGDKTLATATDVREHLVEDSKLDEPVLVTEQDGMPDQSEGAPEATRSFASVWICTQDDTSVFDSAGSAPNLCISNLPTPAGLATLGEMPEASPVHSDKGPNNRVRGNTEMHFPNQVVSSHDSWQVCPVVSR